MICRTPSPQPSPDIGSGVIDDLEQIRPSVLGSISTYIQSSIQDGEEQDQFKRQKPGLDTASATTLKGRLEAAGSKNLLSSQDNKIHSETLNAAIYEPKTQGNVSLATKIWREQSPFISEKCSQSTLTTPTRVDSATHLGAQQKPEVNLRVLAKHQPKSVDITAPTTLEATLNRYENCATEICHGNASDGLLKSTSNGSSDPPPFRHRLNGNEKAPPPDSRLSVSSLLEANNKSTVEEPPMNNLNVSDQSRPSPSEAVQQSADLLVFGFDEGEPDVDSPDSTTMMHWYEEPVSSTTEWLRNFQPLDGMSYRDQQSLPLFIANALVPIPRFVGKPFDLFYLHFFINHTARLLVCHDYSHNEFQTLLPQSKSNFSC